MALNYPEAIQYNDILRRLEGTIPGIDDSNPGDFKTEPRSVPSGLTEEELVFPVGHIAFMGDFVQKPQT